MRPPPPQTPDGVIELCECAAGHRWTCLKSFRAQWGRTDREAPRWIIRSALEVPRCPTCLAVPIMHVTQTTRAV